MSLKRQKAVRAGFRAEFLAAFFLMFKGYRVLESRYRTPVGEIDLIVGNRKRIAFVEVKGRQALSEALYAVSPHQQRRIRRAAEHWLASHDVSCRRETGFDVVAIVPWGLPRHFRDAFSHGGQVVN